MTTQTGTDIENFAARVRLLIEKANDLQEENRKLNEKLLQQQQLTSNLKAELEEAKKKHDTLLAAKMLSVTDNDLDETKKKINSLIRSVNQCITLYKGIKDDA